MAFKDPHIALGPALCARAFRGVFPLVWRLRYSSPDVQFATKPIGKPRQVTVPTRHGAVRALIYAPLAVDVATQLAAGHKPPAHLRMHASAFVLRMPEQEDNVARYLASEVGCYVVLPDFDTAPDVRFPVAEQQNYDVFLWMREHAGDYGWDADRITVGGASAGGKFALNVALQAIDAGEYLPLAVSAEYGAADVSLPDSRRTSPKRWPVVAPWMMRLARATYFTGADLADPLASPARHPRLVGLPPTLILTGGCDTMRHEMNALAGDLQTKGVRVTHRQFAGVDHFFTHAKPVEVARAAIGMIGDLLRQAYSDPMTRA